MPDTPDVQATIPVIPTQPNPDLPQGLSVGLQAPGQITVPGTAADVAQPAPQPAPPNPQHVIGRAFGKVLSGLSGGHTEYTIDPQTGTTIPTQVKDPPGQTFRSILALGLMGGQGIGPSHGEHTFTQGLLSGLGGGVRESTERNDMLDKQRRQQAQEQYANQLRAAQEERENKKLSMEEQLNQVAIADHNQNIVARKQIMDQQAYTFAKEKAVDAAAPLMQNSQLLTEADAPKVNGYKSLNVDPLASGLTQAEAMKYLADHPGASVKELGLHTGTRATFDPLTGKMGVEDLYSIYPVMNKVPPSLLQQMKSDGADKPGSTLHNAYMELTANKDGNVDVRKLLPIYRDMTDWENLQKSSQERRLKEAEIFKDYQSGAAESVRLQLEKMGLKEKTDQQNAQSLFNQFFDIQSNSLKPTTSSSLQAGQPDPITHQGKMSEATAAQYRDLLQMGLVARYEDVQDKYTKDFKNMKDAAGNPVKVSDDPQLTPFINFMSGLKTAQQQLANPQGYAAKQQTLQGLSGIARNVVADIMDKGVTDPVQIQGSVRGLPPEIQAQIFQALKIQPPQGSPASSTPAGNPHLSPLGNAVVDAGTAAKSGAIPNPLSLIP